jgi:hypothetical protein
MVVGTSTGALLGTALRLGYTPIQVSSLSRERERERESSEVERESTSLLSLLHILSLSLSLSLSPSLSLSLIPNQVFELYRDFASKVFERRRWRQVPQHGAHL